MASFSVCQEQNGLLATLFLVVFVIAISIPDNAGPKCPDDQIVRILEYGIHAEEPTNPYNDKCKRKAKYGFTLAFKLYCENCGHTDFVKLSNTGWPGCSHSEILR